jgi:hypothetical protein
LQSDSPNSQELTDNDDIDDNDVLRDEAVLRSQSIPIQRQPAEVQHQPAWGLLESRSATMETVAMGTTPDD